MKKSIRTIHQESHKLEDIYLPIFFISPNDIGFSLFLVNATIEHWKRAKAYEFDYIGFSVVIGENKGYWFHGIYAQSRDTSDHFFEADWAQQCKVECTREENGVSKVS